MGFVEKLSRIGFENLYQRDRNVVADMTFGIDYQPGTLSAELDAGGHWHDETRGMQPGHFG